jgi:hypothetical protein
MQGNELKERLDKLKPYGWTKARVARELYKKRYGSYPEGRNLLYSTVHKAFNSPKTHSVELVGDIVSILGGVIPDPVWLEPERLKSSD